VTQGLERKIGRKSLSEKVGDRSSEGIDKMKEGKEDNGTNKIIRLGHLSTLLHAYENRIFGELWVVRSFSKPSFSSTNII
jgi:hypothetical protein